MYIFFGFWSHFPFHLKTFFRVGGMIVHHHLLHAAVPWIKTLFKFVEEIFSFFWEFVAFNEREQTTIEPHLIWCLALPTPPDFCRLQNLIWVEENSSNIPHHHHHHHHWLRLSSMKKFSAELGHTSIQKIDPMPRFQTPRGKWRLFSGFLAVADLGTGQDISTFEFYHYHYFLAACEIAKRVPQSSWKWW